MSITAAVLLSMALCAAMLLCLEGGFQVGVRSKDDDTKRSTHSVFEAAIFALLGLLLGFAFAGSMSRLDARRDLIVREANAIGTAYLRIDILPQPVQADMRALFHAYLEARLRVFDDVDSGRDFEPAMTAASQLQRQIWTMTIGARTMETTEGTDQLFIPAINDMIDVTTARAVALRTQTPGLILALLLGMALLTSLIAGYNMAKAGRRSPLHGLLYVVAVTLTIYVILDLDNPRRGLIRLDGAEQVLRQLERSI